MLLSDKMPRTQRLHTLFSEISLCLHWQQGWYTSGTLRKWFTKPTVQDILCHISRWKKKTWKKEEIFDVPPFLLNMIVVKLNGGGLLLYAPVRV